MIRAGAKRGWIRLLWLMTLLATGILPNHQSCSIVTRGAVTDGVSRFISDLTLDTLNGILRPGNTGDSDSDGDSGGDPFAPPAQT